jgi:hypothetical protein
MLYYRHQKPNLSLRLNSYMPSLTSQERPVFETSIAAFNGTRRFTQHVRKGPSGHCPYAAAFSPHRSNFREYYPTANYRTSCMVSYIQI